MRNNHRRVKAPRPSAGRWPSMVGIGMGLLTWSSLASGLASAQAISSCPVAINQTGAYVVTQDLTCSPSEVAIYINASNVILDLRGHTVSGGGGPGHGIVVGPVTGVTINDGRITGFGGYGLALDRSINASVARMEVTQTGNIGILGWGVHNVTISSVNVAGPTSGGGVVVGNGSSNVGISFNLVTNTRGYGGIAMVDSGGYVAFNRATGNFVVTPTGDVPLDAYTNSPTCAGTWWFANDFRAVIPDCIR